MDGQQFSQPDKMIENNEIKNGSKNVANILNRYYIQKVRKIREDLMNKNKSDPLIHYTNKIPEPDNKLGIKTINMSQLRNIMRSMKKSKSTGVDNVSMEMIINIKLSIEPILLKIVNNVMEKQKFPNILKVNKIIPKKKENKILEPSNYRPINLLSPISKIIE